MDSGGPSVALAVLELLRQRQCADSSDTRMPLDTTTLARELHTFRNIQPASYFIEGRIAPFPATFLASFYKFPNQVLVASALQVMRGLGTVPSKSR